MRIEVEHVTGQVAQHLRLGDEFALHGTARVVGIRDDEFIDTSNYEAPRSMSGERTVTLSVVLSKDAV